MNIRKPLKLKEEPPVDYDHERCGGGRRSLDFEHTRRVEIHPGLLSLSLGMVTVLVSIIGYFVKGWAEDVKTELRALRSVVEKQGQDAAVNGEWKTNMSRWRDDADQHFKDIDYQLAGRRRREKDALPAAVVPVSSRRQSTP